jgi:hypothetical protein
MPINKKMMKNLKKEYWEKWENIYYAIENKNKGIKRKKGIPKKK